MQAFLDKLDPQSNRKKRTVVFGYRELTRDEANDWLQQVDETHQRNLSRSVVERYRRDMNNGDWAPATNLIAFDKKAKLINGQHTLAAFAGSNLKTLPILWTINQHEKAYLAFDYNRKRTPADALKWDGNAKAQDLPPMATALWQYQTQRFEGRKFLAARSGEDHPTASQVKQTVELNRGLDAHIYKNPFRGAGFSVGAMNAALYLFDSIDPKRAAKFREMFFEGVGFETKQHPILVLRKEFMAMPEKARERNGVTILKFFKAWNYWVRGEGVAGKLIKTTDVFEHPIDPKDLAPIAPGPRGPQVVQ